MCLCVSFAFVRCWNLCLTLLRSRVIYHPHTTPAFVAGFTVCVCACVFCVYVSLLAAAQKGGNAEAVDYQGVLNTAQACVDLGVPRLVVVSRYGAI